MSGRAPMIVSRGMLAAAGMLIATTLIAVFVLPRPAPGSEHGPERLVQQRLLQFDDRADGAVVVTDAQTGRTVEVVTGQSGFLRCAMAGLARIRQVRNIGPAAPFALTAYADHRLTIADPATGESIELEAFGPTNEAVFSRFLAGERDPA